MSLRVLLLGSPVVEQDGTAVTLDRRKALALLAYLALSSGGQQRETLAALLWPEQDRDRSLAAVRRTLAALNQALDGPYLQADRKSIELIRQPELCVDVWEFEELLSHSPSPGETGAFGWLADAEQAVDLYRDDFLKGFTLRDSESFDEWQLLEGERLRRQLIRGLERLVEGYRTTLNFPKAIEYAHRWLTLDPLAEEVHRYLMSLYAAAGQRSEAIHQYGRCQEILRDQLDVEPEQETTRLFEAIKVGSVRPEGPLGSTPAIDTDTAATPLNNLPDPSTPFIGRSSELEQLVSRLKEASSRLITVIGPGGIGKTRLALEAARQVASDFADGVCFVSLATSTPALVVSTIAEGLDLALTPQGNPQTQVIHYLSRRNILLILDNFEEVVERADVVAGILREASRVEMIVTSRESLNLHGEVLLEITGLKVPPPDAAEMEDYSAVQLFVQAAGRVRADFEINHENRSEVAKICRLVFGIPLGIELAAAWLRLLSCAEISGEIEKNLDFLETSLRDVPERHRSLRAVFTSSVDLLSSEENAIFRKLSIFRGGFDREAAEAVAGASLGSLLALVNKSLIARNSASRFEVHELLRQFTLETPRSHPEEDQEIGLIHCRYYLAFLSSRSEALYGDRQKETMERIRFEIDNIRSAWLYAVNQRLASLIGQSLEGIYRFFQLASWFVEGEEMLDAGRSAIAAAEEPLIHAQLSSRQGRFCHLLGRFQKTRTLIEPSLEVFRELEVPQELAQGLYYLSGIYYHFGEFDRARRLSEESEAICRQIGDRHGTASALVQLGRILGVVGETEKSRLKLNEGLSIFSELGDQNGIGRCIINLGNVAFMSGYHLEALRLYQESLEVSSRVQDRKGMASCLNNLGLVYEELGQHEKAKQLTLQGLDLFKEIGYQDPASRNARIGPAGALENLGRATFALKQFDESRRHFFEAFKTSCEINAIPQALIALMGLARLLGHQGEPARAWEWLTFVQVHPKANEEAKVYAATLREGILSQISAEEREQAEKSATQADFDKIVSDVFGIFDTTSLPV